MSFEGHSYSIEELLELEKQMNEDNTTKQDLEETFSFLEGHSHFSHIDDSNAEFRSYYFHNPDNGSELLFIDIPKNNGIVYSDKGSCIGQQDWFDELYSFTKKMYEQFTLMHK